jgi:hypothetical protein
MALGNKTNYLTERAKLTEYCRNITFHNTCRRNDGMKQKEKKAFGTTNYGSKGQKKSRNK